MRDKTRVVKSYVNEKYHTKGDYKMQDTAPVEVSCAILIGKSDKLAMINKCLKKRKELLDAQRK